MCFFTYCLIDFTSAWAAIAIIDKGGISSNVVINYSVFININICKVKSYSIPNMLNVETFHEFSKCICRCFNKQANLEEIHIPRRYKNLNKKI